MVNVKEFSLCDVSYNVSKKYIKREKTTYEYINLPCAFDIEVYSGDKLQNPEDENKFIENQDDYKM